MIIHYPRFVMELLQWHKVCELGGDKFHRPPVVALNFSDVLWAIESSSHRFIHPKGVHSYRYFRPPNSFVICSCIFSGFNLSMIGEMSGVPHELPLFADL